MSRHPPDRRGRACEPGGASEGEGAVERLRLLCDEMLLGLGRWLRIAGYDTAIATAGMPDDAVIALAAVEERILLTCDRRLAARTQRVDVLTLPTEGLDAAALELKERLGVDWLCAPFTRCLVDNASLRPANPADLARIPEISRAGPGPIRACPECGRVYWPGSHVRRMRARLEQWRNATQRPQSPGADGSDAKSPSRGRRGA